MRLDKFTEKAQEAILNAQDIAVEHHHSQVDPEHLLYALLRQEKGIVPEIVRKIGQSPEEMASKLEEDFRRRPKIYGPSAQIGISQPLHQVLLLAQKEAQAMRDEYISTEHLLLALTDKVAGQVANFLALYGLTRDSILRALAAIKGNPAGHYPNPRGNLPSPGKIRARPHRPGPTGKTGPGYR
jgi:ATPases with chaperone activity, ATP-binding subunit